MTGDQLGKIKIWNDDGNLAQTLAGPNSFVQSLKLLPNRNLISGYDDGTMIIWNLTNGLKAFEWLPNAAHSSSIFAFEVINEFTVASASRDTFIKFWNFSNGSLINSITNPNGGISSLLLLNNGSLLSGDEAGDHLIRIWSVNSASSLGSLSVHTDSVNALELITSEILASGGLDNRIIVWNLTNGQILKTLIALTSTQVWSLKRLTDTTFASGYADHNIYLWDLSTNSNTYKNMLSGHTHTVEALDLLNDTILLSGSQDGTFKMWDISSGTLLNSIQTGYRLYSLIRSCGIYKISI